MGQLQENFLAVLEDLKKSWYFRVWFAVWCILAIMSFVAFVILTNDSNEVNVKNSFQTWSEEVSELHFPHFRFVVPPPAKEKINSAVTCHYNTRYITALPCTGHEEPQTCYYVNTTGVIAQRDAPATHRMNCTFTTNAVLNSENLLILFETVGEDHANLGGALRGGVYVGPNANAWIGMSKSWIKFYNRPAMHFWSKKLVYHSTVSINGVYNIEVGIDSLRVRLVEERNSYDSWLALGASGGFAYFMVILHIIVMIVVGVVLNNDSKFLGSRGDSASYEPVPSGSADHRVY